MRLLNDFGFEIVASAGEGAVIECSKRPLRFGAGHVERALQHWRIRGLLNALNLLDETMIVARKQLPA